MREDTDIDNEEDLMESDTEANGGGVHVQAAILQGLMNGQSPMDLVQGLPPELIGEMLRRSLPPDAVRTIMRNMGGGSVIDAEDDEDADEDEFEEDTVDQRHVQPRPGVDVRPNVDVAGEAEPALDGRTNADFLNEMGYYISSILEQMHEGMELGITFSPDPSAGRRDGPRFRISAATYVRTGEGTEIIARKRANCRRFGDLIETVLTETDQSLDDDDIEDFDPDELSEEDE